MPIIIGTRGIVLILSIVAGVCAAAWKYGQHRAAKERKTEG